MVYLSSRKYQRSSPFLPSAKKAPSLIICSMLLCLMKRNALSSVMIGIIIVGTFFAVFYVVYVDEMKPMNIPENTNFTLYVSNQSTDHRTVDIKVTIDGKLEIDRFFDVGDQHQVYPFYFNLEQGDHTVQIDAKDASYQKEFTIDDELWLAAAYWYDKDDHESPRIIVDTSNGPIGFQ